MIKNLELEFKYKTTPMKHQEDWFQKTRNSREFGILWEMGTGKTKLIIDTAMHLFIAGEIDGLLVVSDKGGYLNWPDEEIPKHMHEQVPYRVGFWSSYFRSGESRQLDEIMTAKDDCLDIMCLNIEALSAKNSKALNAAKKFINNHYVMMVVDEATSIKNVKAQRTKNAILLGQMCDYRRIMTGTPITQSPLDTYAMFEFLKRGCLGFWSFVSFRSFYAVMVTMHLGSRSFQKIEGFHRLDELRQTLEPLSTRMLKTECEDLPDKVYETVYVEHTDEQKRAYNSIANEALAMFDQGMLTVTSAMTAVNKLHQVNCGHIKLDDGNTIEIPSNRVSSLLEELEKIGDNKAIIWCRFQKDVELIVDALRKFIPGKRPVHYYGKTPDHLRRENLTSFKNLVDCPWFVGTAATGGKSITLTEAHNVFYYSTDHNLEDRLQSEDRAHRHGQVNKVLYKDFVVRNTIDVKILAGLKQKKDLSYEVLDKFRELVSPI